MQKQYRGVSELGAGLSQHYYHKTWALSSFSRYWYLWIAIRREAGIVQSHTDTIQILTWKCKAKTLYLSTTYSFKVFSFEPLNLCFVFCFEKSFTEKNRNNATGKSIIFPYRLLKHSENIEGFPHNRLLNIYTSRACERGSFIFFLCWRALSRLKGLLYKFEFLSKFQHVVWSLPSSRFFIRLYRYFWWRWRLFPRSSRRGRLRRRGRRGGRDWYTTTVHWSVGNSFPWRNWSFGR